MAGFGEDAEMTGWMVMRLGFGAKEDCCGGACVRRVGNCCCCCLGYLGWVWIVVKNQLGELPLGLVDICEIVRGTQGS